MVKLFLVPDDYTDNLICSSEYCTNVYVLNVYTPLTYLLCDDHS